MPPASPPSPAPTRLLLVPLPDFVHFPRTDLRLEFGVDDRELVERMLADGVTQAVGTVLIRPTWAREEAGASRVFPAGTGGRVISHRSLPDGGCRVLVRGEYRFSVTREIGGGTVREALVEPVREPHLSDVDPGVMALRDDLTAAIGSLVRDLEAFPLSREQLDAFDQGVPFEAFVNSVASALDLSPLRKLSLLGDDLPERARNLLSILRVRGTVFGLLRPFRHLRHGASAN